MTRNEFNRRFAANLENTSGFSEADLAKINEAVFGEVVGLDADDASDAVKSAFEAEFNRWYAKGPAQAGPFLLGRLCANLTIPLSAAFAAKNSFF